MNETIAAQPWVLRAELQVSAVDCRACLWGGAEEGTGAREAGKRWFMQEYEGEEPYEEAPKKKKVKLAARKSLFDERAEERSFEDLGH